MCSKLLVPVLALAALFPAAPAAASLNDFRLPTDRPQEQPPPDLQGPVAPDVPASRRLAPAPTPTAARTEVPGPTTAPPRIEVPTGLQAAPSASPTRRSVTPGPTTAPTAAAEAALPDLPAAETSASAGSPPSQAQPAGPVAARSAAKPGQDGWSWLALLAALSLLLAALGLAARALRNRVRRPTGPVTAPRIERPRLGTAPEATQPLTLPGSPAEPLQVSLEPLRLSLTLMNATLAYRLELANHGSAPLARLTIGADMISAHASMSREEQLSGPRAGNGAAPVQRIERLEPGESRIVEGEFRLPFPQIVPIRQGNAALLLPLARFRIDVEGARPVVRTFVVGQPGQSSGLQPFRLDEGPRVYPRLAQRAFA